MQTYVAFHDVVGVRVDVSGEAEITDLCYPSLSQEDISGGQISVDALEEEKKRNAPLIPNDP